jgi:hypothetical protein
VGTIKVVIHLNKAMGNLLNKVIINNKVTAHLHKDITDLHPKIKVAIHLKIKAVILLKIMVSAKREKKEIVKRKSTEKKYDIWQFYSYDFSL